MRACVRLSTTPQPGNWPRVVVLVVILIVVTTPLVRNGYSLPDVLTFLLGAGVAGAQAARPLPVASIPGGA